MKSIILCGIAAAGVVFAQSALAADNAAPAVANGTIVQSNNQISLDVVGSYLWYEEYNDIIRSPTLPSGVLDSEKGWVPGLSVQGSYMGDLGSFANFYASGELSWLHGHTAYWSAPVQQTDDADIANLDLRFGEGFAVSPDTMVTPFVGGGYRSWNRNLVGPGGYNEIYSNGYAGAGVLVQYNPSDRLVLSTSAFVGTTIAPHLHASPNGGAAIPVTDFALGMMPVVKIGASGDYALTDQWHANFGVDYSYFGFGESPIVGSAYEPDSRTASLTIKVGLGFHY